MTTTKPKPYYTLVFKEGDHLAEPWGIAFGDYDKEVVEQEMEDEIERLDAPRSAFIIIHTEGDTQAEIDAAVARLNEMAPPPDYEA